MKWAHIIRWTAYATVAMSVLFLVLRLGAGVRSLSPAYGVIVLALALFQLYAYARISSFTDDSDPPPHQGAAGASSADDAGEPASINGRIDDRLADLQRSLLRRWSITFALLVILGAGSIVLETQQQKTASQATQLSQKNRDLLGKIVGLTRSNSRLAARAVALAAKIQTERYDSALDNCRDTNARAAHTVRFLHRALKKASSTERAQERETIAFIHSILPPRDCRAAAAAILAEPSIPIPPSAARHHLTRRPPSKETP